MIIILKLFLLFFVFSFNAYADEGDPVLVDIPADGGIELSGDALIGGAIRSTDNASRFYIFSSNDNYAGANIAMGGYDTGDTTAGSMYLGYGDYVHAAPSAASFNIRTLDNSGISTVMHMNLAGNMGLGNILPLERLHLGGTNPRLYMEDSTVPGTTANTLYSVSGALYWNGNALEGGGGGGSSDVPWLSPSDYSVAGGGYVDDGIDDTATFAAVLAAATNGQIVQCEAGVYNFSGHFTIPEGVHLRGVKAGNYFIDDVPDLATNMKGTVFLPTEVLADNYLTYFIKMESNSRISELAVYYQGQTTDNETPTAYPWTLYTIGDVRGVVVNDVSVYRCYKFMFAHGSSFTVSNVYGHIIKYGIFDTKGGDTNYYTNIHFQPVHAYGHQWDVDDLWVWSCSNGAIAFYTGTGSGGLVDWDGETNGLESGGPGNSWNKFTNCFAYGFETVFYVDYYVQGTSLTNCGGDFSKHPFYLLGRNTTLNSCNAVAGDRSYLSAGSTRVVSPTTNTITSGSQGTAYHGFTIGSSSTSQGDAKQVSMSNCQAWFLAGAAVYIKQAEDTSINGLTVDRWGLATDSGEWGAIHLDPISATNAIAGVAINGLNTDTPGTGGSSVYYANANTAYAQFLTVSGSVLRGDGASGTTFGLRGTTGGACISSGNVYMYCDTDYSGSWTSGTP